MEKVAEIARSSSKISSRRKNGKKLRENLENIHNVTTKNGANVAKNTSEKSLK